MADISSMTLPNGSTYNVKDEAARSGSGLIEMTKAQYDVLSSAEKNDGKVRFITDVGVIMKNGVAYGGAYGGAVSISLSGTIETTDWTGAVAPYAAQISASGLLATDKPVVDVVMSGTYSTDESRDEAWELIYRAAAGADTITFYAREVPAVDLPFSLFAVRK